MDWGDGITYLLETSLKGQQTPFGIKDEDRKGNVALIGKVGSGRSEFLTHMALQDAERGIGTVVLDAGGHFAQMLLERLSPDAREHLIYIDPSDAEYPFSWNALDEYRALPKEKALPLLSDALVSLYHATASPLISFAVERMLEDPKSTLLYLYELVAEPVVREKLLPSGDPLRTEFDALLAKEADAVALIRQNGRYLAKDTLVRNALGQADSRFTLEVLKEGGTIVVDLSRIRMFPTRITPLVRLFLHAMRAYAARAGNPPAVYIHDCLRCIDEEDIPRLFSERAVLSTLSDSIYIEEDRLIREKILMQAASVISFSPNPADVSLVERIFFPYVQTEDFQKLGEGEAAVLLTIDSVRSRPFFAHTLKLSPRTNLSFQDIQVFSRQKYATSRHVVDQAFYKRLTPAAAAKPKDGDPASFSNAFRSIFSKNAPPAGKAPPSSVPPVPSAPKPAAPPAPAPAPAVKATANADANKKPVEVSEEELREMMYVRQIPS